jgi:hypothetical protein
MDDDDLPRRYARVWLDRMIRDAHECLDRLYRNLHELEQLAAGARLTAHRVSLDLDQIRHACDRIDLEAGELERLEELVRQLRATNGRTPPDRRPRARSAPRRREDSHETRPPPEDRQ